jgi:hypothetical protein
LREKQKQAGEAPWAIAWVVELSAFSVPVRNPIGGAMTIAWFVIWFIANIIGGGEPLELDPVTGWTATLVLAAAFDLNRPRPEWGRGKA